jgi:hypothetical protein
MKVTLNKILTFDGFNIRPLIILFFTTVRRKFAVRIYAKLRTAKLVIFEHTENGEK